MTKAQQPIRVFMAMSIALWAALLCCCDAKAFSQAMAGEASPAMAATGGCSQCPATSESEAPAAPVNDACGCDGEVKAAPDTSAPVVYVPVLELAPIAGLLAQPQLSVSAFVIATADHPPPPTETLISLHCQLTT